MFQQFGINLAKIAYSKLMLLEKKRSKIVFTDLKLIFYAVTSI